MFRSIMWSIPIWFVRLELIVYIFAHGDRPCKPGTLVDGTSGVNLVTILVATQPLICRWKIN